MLNRMIYHRVVLAGLMVVLTCFGRGAEPLKIGMVSSYQLAAPMRLAPAAIMTSAVRP
jgi:hypothetical protein